MGTRVEKHGSLGLLWFIGWLFTIGFLKQGFWMGVLGLFVWPYFLGAHFAEPAAIEAASQAPASQIISE